MDALNVWPKDFLSSSQNTTEEKQMKKAIKTLCQQLAIIVVSIFSLNRGVDPGGHAGLALLPACT